MRHGTPVAARGHSTLQKLWKDRWIYLFLLPTVVLYGMYTLWPMAASWYYSLLDWNGFEQRGTFIGLGNYRELVRDPLFWNAFNNTLTFLLLAVPLRVGLAFVLALILNDPRLPLARVFRTAIFLPVVTTGAIVGVVMRLILDPNSGPINLALLNLGLTPSSRSISSGRRAQRSTAPSGSGSGNGWASPSSTGWPHYRRFQPSFMKRRVSTGQGLSPSCGISPCPCPFPLPSLSC